jgi:hypothetical protein
MAVVLLCGAFGLAGKGQAELIVIEPPRWGFDGKARIGQFNLLTVSVLNNSDRPWEGVPRLEAALALGYAGLPIVQPGLFLEPHGQRRLQFLVFLPSATDFNFIWGRRLEERFKIDEPPVAKAPAEIQLTERQGFTAGARSLPQFDEADFPASAGGLDALGSMHLDHVPAWSDAQARASLDWLSAGGKLHLYRQTGGKSLDFRGPLAALNEPSEAFAVGGGQVLRHGENLREAAVAAPPAGEANRYPSWQPTRSLFESLKLLTRPDHNWTAIYALAIAYLLLLFPGCWLLGRRRGDYRITYGALLGIVCLFSLGFRAIGARGYGEETTVNAVALARSAAGDRWLVTQWSNLFVTSGAEYKLSHATEGTVYSAGQTDEPLPGFVVNRPQGLIDSDVPSFSSRTWIHAGVLNAPGLRLRPERLVTENGRLQTGEFVAETEALWKDDPLFVAYALCGKQVYPLSAAGSVLRLHGAPIDLKSHLEDSQWHRGNYGFDRKNSETAAQIFQRCPGMLLAQDLHLDSDADRDQFQLPDGELRVYAYARMPPEFHVTGTTAKTQTGRVLYVQSFHLDEP